MIGLGGGDQLDWLGTGRTGFIVAQKLMAASHMRYELAQVAKRPRQNDFGFNHRLSPTVAGRLSSTQR